MAEQSEQILIEVKFDTSAVDGARKALQENLNQLAANKKELANLNKNIQAGNALTEEGAKRYAQLNKDIEENKRAIKSNTAIIQAASQARATENDTLDMQRQYLNTLQKAFAGLTKEQKDAMGGAEQLQQYIKSLSDSLIEQEHAIGENGRNVGNYAESMQKAFGEMAHAGELLSPAVGLLRGMGGEGKKAAAALDALSKVMQLAGKASKVLATAKEADKVATEGATVAQNGLNAAMAANPIGLIVAGISTLLPLVQAMISAFGDASKETEAFNNELERQNKLIEQAQADAEFEAKVAGIMGASAAEQLRIRKKAAQEAYDQAEDEVNRLLDISRTGSKKEKKAAKEALDEAYSQRDAAYKQLQNLNQEATLQELKDVKQREDDKQKIIDQATEDRKKKRKEEADAERQQAIEEFEARRVLMGFMYQQMTEEELAKMQQSIQALMPEDFEEEEEEDDIPSPEEQALKSFGLDSEGLELYKSLLADGMSAQEAMSQALEAQWKRNARAVTDSLHKMGDGFSDLGDALGNFAEDNEKAAAAQKAFSLIGILTNEAASIAEGALAISEGVASAASLPFPANIPAIISITATIAGLLAGVASTIASAKQLFNQADNVGGFETGGIVGGTSYHGDKLTANVNSGEMILPTNYQEELFDALSSSANGERTLGIDYEMMATAMASVPAPVVVYKELQEFGDRVSTYDEIASV